MRFHVIGFDSEGFCDEFNGVVVVSHLMGDHTKQMQGDRLIGIDLQHLLIDALRFRQAARIMVLNGKVQVSLNGWRLFLGGRVY